MEFPRKTIPDLLDNKKELIFQITDWYIPESDKSRPKKHYDEEQDLYTILLYGNTENSETVSVNIIDYKPSFYVKAPIEWDELSDNEYIKRLCKLNTISQNEKYEAEWQGKKYQKKLSLNNT